MAEKLAQTETKSEKLAEIEEKRVSIYVFSNTITIEHIILIYWISTDDPRFILTRQIFKYYTDLRDVLLKTHKIVLNFTIVGSNGNDSLSLFENYLCINNNIFNDTYIEFDQSKYKTKPMEELLNMLDKKWEAGLISVKTNEKACDIIVLRGSNDIVEPFIYIQLKHQFEPMVDKLYVSSKTIPSLNIFNLSIICKCSKNKECIELPNVLNTEKNCYFNNQYPKSHNETHRKTISTIAFIGFSSTLLDRIIIPLKNKKLTISNEMNFETYIRKNICNLMTLTNSTFFINPKVSINDITSFEFIKNAYNNVNISKISNDMKQRIYKLVEYFNTSDINLLFEIANNYTNVSIDQKLLSKYSKITKGDHFHYTDEGTPYRKQSGSLFNCIDFTTPPAFLPL